jgi:ribonuclease HI/exonuclease III
MAPSIAAPHVLQAEDPGVGGSRRKGHRGDVPTTSMLTSEMVPIARGPEESPASDNHKRHLERHALQDITNKSTTQGVTPGNNNYANTGTLIQEKNLVEETPGSYVINKENVKETSTEIRYSGPTLEAYSKEGGPWQEKGTTETAWPTHNTEDGPDKGQTEPPMPHLGPNISPANPVTSPTPGPSTAQLGFEEEDLGLQFGPNMRRYLELQDQSTVDVMVDTAHRQLQEWNREASMQQTENFASTQSKTRTKKNARGTLKFMSINVRGHGQGMIGSNTHRWHEITKVMLEEKVGVGLLQETHISDRQADQLRERYRAFEIFTSYDETRPNSKGVAILLNKRYLQTNDPDVKMFNLMPGRALLVTIRWAKTKITILNLYAPTIDRASENAKFWTDLSQYWEKEEARLPKPDIIGGDFNIVEDQIDRLPPHPDGTGPTLAFLDFKTLLNVQDGWRRNHTERKEFTYGHSRSTGNPLSRLDRFYVTEDTLINTNEWDIYRTPGKISTDHHAITFRMHNPSIPFIGRGRWSMPLYLVDDKALQEEVRTLAVDLQRELETNRGARSESANPQLLYKHFKGRMIQAIRTRAKRRVPKVKKIRKQLDHDFEQLTKELSKPDLSQEQISLLTIDLHDKMQEMSTLEKRITVDQNLNSKVRYLVEGEKMTKYWTTLTKVTKPQDIIHCLKKPAPPGMEDAGYATRTKEMAEVARGYHEQLQNDPLENSQQDERELAILEALNNIPASQKLSTEESLTLEGLLNQETIEAALKKLPKGKAGGLDGLPTEWWKKLYTLSIEEAKDSATNRDGKPHLDIIGILLDVYQDISNYGSVEGESLANGWMCPMYKKNARDNIANYRPITLLNSDYKILTKAMSLALNEVVSKMVHPDQAGFIPGRRIQDQIRLAQTIIDWAEEVGENGIIISLDQEKAYDKVKHDYIRRTFEAFNIPTSFNNLFFAIGKYATTRVMINGDLSLPYTVTRGFRQGCPLSCIAFDLAIEPLACMLRNSGIQGFEVPGKAERIITMLFADDTSCYLSENDSFTELKGILDTWCLASGAKFNISKTVVIPVGTPAYREEVIKTRQMNPREEPIPDDVRIMGDREATRVLGGWIGNNVDPIEPWNRIIEEIVSSLERWNRCSPTVEARKLIVQMVVSGKSQYLQMVNGMPGTVRTRLNSIMTKFMNGQRSNPTIGQETLRAPREEGGYNLLDLEAQDEAIHLMWVKSYLSNEDIRPAWAYVADDIFRQHERAEDKDLEITLRKSPFLQSWSPNSKTLTKKGHERNERLKRMLTIAKKHGVLIERPSRQSALAMPAWSHKHMKRAVNLTTRPSCCLRRVHKVVTIRDLLNISRRGLMESEDNPSVGHNRGDAQCKCTECTTDRMSGCSNPHQCAYEAMRIISNLQPEWDPTRLPDEPEENPNNHEGNAPSGNIFQEPKRPTTIAGSFRVSFKTRNNKRNNKGQSHKQPIIRIPARQPLVRSEGREVVVYTDGSCFNNGEYNARAGSGIHFPDRQEADRCIRLPPNVSQSNQAGEIVALIEALRRISRDTPVRVCTDSRYTKDALTKNLGKNEDQGWSGMTNGHLFQLAAAELRQRTARTTVEWVKAHDGNKPNETADEHAKNGANKKKADWINTNLREGINPTGVKLQALTRSLAYRVIRAGKRQVPMIRKGTERHLQLARSAVEEISGTQPTNESIWRLTKDPTLLPKHRQFLWRTAHNGFKAGEWWLHVHGREFRAECNCTPHLPHETMGHILTECLYPGQSEIWALVKSLWEMRGQKWPYLNVGLLVGIAQVSFPDPNNPGNPNHGPNRLFKILVSESAYLIWLLRCERVIEHQNSRTASVAEIHNRWLTAINARLQIDRHMTNRYRYKGRALPAQVVRDTWSGILKNEESLPEEWEKKSGPGVLVGIEPIK